MNSKLYRSFVIPALAAVLAFGVCRTAFAQQAEVQQQEQRKSSIKKMQTRIAEIEKEMKSAATQRSQELGNEAFELFGQIDQTYLQLRNVYQQQMIQLNERVRQTWLELENAQGLARETTDKKLETLEKDWERSYQRLTESHDRHLAQLKDGLSKLRGEFSAAASQAQAELESSHFESIADWEKAHELVLDVNRAYVEIVGNQLSGLESLHKNVPDSKDIQNRLQRTSSRYLKAQKRLQSRIESHLAHLGTLIFGHTQSLVSPQTRSVESFMWSPRIGIDHCVNILWQNAVQILLESPASNVRESVQDLLDAIM